MAHIATPEALHALGEEHTGQAHWETSPWPLFLGLGILFVLPFPFSLYFVYQKPLLAVLCLGIGVPLTVASIVGWVKEAMAGHGEGLSVPAMPWFILAEALIFVGFFAAYWFMRLSASAWPPAGSVAMPKLLPAVMTALLIASSLTFHGAEVAHERGRRQSFLAWLVLTMVLGASFVSLSAYEWNHLMGEGFGFGSNAFSTAFYSITGFHAAHVVVGLGIFLAILLPALRARTNTAFIKAGGMYWHFVDIVWLFVVSQLYFW